MSKGKNEFVLMRTITMEQFGKTWISPTGSDQFPLIISCLIERMNLSPRASIIILDRNLAITPLNDVFNSPALDLNHYDPKIGCNNNKIRATVFNIRFVIDEIIVWQFLQDFKSTFFTPACFSW